MPSFELTNYGAERVLNTLLNGSAITAPGTMYLGLHTAAPGSGGSNEIVDASYARLSIADAFPAISGADSGTSGVALAFAALTNSHTISHWALWDAVTGGNCWGGVPFSASVSVSAGSGLTISSGLVFNANAA